jgi:DNA-binding transcriptional regulator/RsmH inhibitor MraZ
MARGFDGNVEKADPSPEDRRRITASLLADIDKVAAEEQGRLDVISGGIDEVKLEIAVLQKYGVV